MCPSPPPPPPPSYLGFSTIVITLKSRWRANIAKPANTAKPTNAGLTANAAMPVNTAMPENAAMPMILTGCETEMHTYGNIAEVNCFA